MSIFSRITNSLQAKPAEIRETIRNRIKAGEQKSKPRENTAWERFYFNSGGKIKDYKRMVRDDAQIKAGLDLIINSQLSKDFVVTPAGEEDSDKEVADFVDNMLRNMKIPLRRVRKDMLTALPYGKSVSEIVYDYDNNITKDGRIVWKLVRAIHIDSLNEQDWIEYDDYGDPTTIVQTDNDGKKIKIPSEKVILYPFDMEFGDYNGRSILQPVYDHWFMKKKVKEWYHVYLQKLQSPFLHGRVSNATDTNDLQDALDEVREGRTNIVTGTDDEILVVESKNKGSGFLDAIRYHDMMIFRRLGIGSLIFGMDLTSGSYAQSKTQKDILNMFMEGIQEDTVGIFQQKLNELIDINYDVQKYPTFTFEPFSDEDILGLLIALQPYAKNLQIDTESEWFGNVVKTAVERHSDVVTREVTDHTAPAAPTTSKAPEVEEVADEVIQANDSRLGAIKEFLRERGLY